MPTKAKTKKAAADKINAAIARAISVFKPPEDITVDEWADKYRILPPSSAEPGPWRTDRTPYLREPMRALTDPQIIKVCMAASSQVGKTEIELNAIAYIIDQDPGNILYIHPTVEDARKFSRTRISPMFEACERLQKKVHDVKAKSSKAADTILQKSYPGGTLTITGSNSASALSSFPSRYIIGDERDRWALSAGAEGDPWKLAEARQRTYYNKKQIEVSTPTVKGRSKIEASFLEGTQERWCSQCPECGNFSEIILDDLKFDPVCKKINNKELWDLKSDVIYWECPVCNCLTSEETMRAAPAKWVAANPEAYHKKKIRSFWLTAFYSPWVTWKEIVLSVLDNQDDPEKLKVVYNTQLGKLWEDRGGLINEDEMLNRREDYGRREDGSVVEVPDGVLVLTCGVDVQPNRLEYEVVGYGRNKETWGIKRGFIMGDPNDREVWEQLDITVIDRVFYFRNKRGLKISITFVDSGGSNTQSVYEQCRARTFKGVYAIKGKGGLGVPYIRPATKVAIRDNSKIKTWLYTLGVDDGKQALYDAIAVQTPGPSFCHFPLDLDAGYDYNYFWGLLSEKYVDGRWLVIDGHKRNEPLDCRNYANAAFRVLNPNLDQVARSLYELNNPQSEKPKPKPKPQKRRSAADKYYNDW